MANTVTQRTLYGSGSDKYIIRAIHIVSDGSEETDLVIYDNSAFVNSVLRGAVECVTISGSSSVVRLEWDQTADSIILSADPSSGAKYCFKDFGGITNPGGAGATGDILLTTANLDAGDEVSIIIKIRQT